MRHASLPAWDSSEPNTSPRAITKGAVVATFGQVADGLVDGGGLDAEQLGGDLIAIVLGQHVAIAGQAFGHERRSTLWQGLASLH